MHFNHTFTGADGVPHHSVKQVSEWKIMAFGLVLALMVFSLMSIRYTLWGVVSTLAMVEEPQYTYRLRFEKKDNKKADNKDAVPLVADPAATAADADAEAEVTMVKDKPITNKIRSTIAHLHKRAGWLARWRGLGIFVLYAIAHSTLKFILALPVSLVTFGVPMLADSLASIAASMVLAPLATAWVHTVISEPSSKRWYQRLPPRATWKQLWAPSAVVDAVTRLAFVLPAVCGFIMGFNMEKLDGASVGFALAKLFVCFAIGMLTLVSLVIPAIVVLVRIQASLLPEEDESIVPFDRTFGGRVVPRIVGGTGSIGFIDAWKTFEMKARFRIVKLFLKFILVELFFNVFYAICLISLAVAMIGPENIKKLLGHHRRNSGDRND